MRTPKLPDCDGCGQPLRDHSDGFMYVRKTDLLEAQRRHREAAEKVMLRADELPVEARWRTKHHRCQAENESMDYWIDLDDVADPDRALATVLHMFEKNWVPYTDLISAMRKLYPPVA